jgi:putative membrane protein
MSERGNLARGLVAGVGAGLIASLVMNQFQAAWMALSKSEGSAGESSTLKVANNISTSVAGEPVPKAAEAAASDAVHYATGAALGAFYGAASEFAPGIKAGLGTSYGGVVWAALDNGVLPEFKLSKPQGEIAPKTNSTPSRPTWCLD